jgi:hypothetical protein
LDKNHLNDLAIFFLNPNLIVHITNAKFDMHMLKNEGIEIAGTVVCATARERVIHS